MEKKHYIIIGVLFFLILLVVILFFWLIQRGGEDVPEELPGDGAEPPFGPGGDITQPGGPTLIPEPGIGGGDPLNPVDVFVPPVISGRPQSINRLTKIFDGPTAGFFVPDNENPIVVFKRGDGERFEINKETYEIVSTPGPQIPKTIKVFPLGGNSIVVQQQDLVVPTLLSTILFEEYNGDKKGVLIGSNVVVTPKQGGGAFFYSKETSSGVEMRTIQLAQGQTFSFGSPFLSWSAQWNNTNPNLLTRPHPGIDGYFYTLEADGSVTKLLGPIEGLVAQYDESKNIVLYSESRSGTTKTFIKPLENNQKAIELEIETLVDKCVFGVEEIICGVSRGVKDISEIPVSWYKGQVSLNDDLVSFYISSGRIKEVFENKTGEALDVVDGVLVGDLFVFVNKKDLSLWALRVSDEL